MKSKTREETRLQGRIANDTRLRALGDVLALECDAALARLHVLRREGEKDAIALPADRLDLAHSLEEVEMEAGLIERCEDRLRAIDDAFNRLKRGRYGICEKCKQEIPIERLKAMPLAAYCVDCQKKRNERRRPGEGDIDEPSRHVWTPPEELKESVEE
jgi:RNA polymerase-binding protein DksA